MIDSQTLHNYVINAVIVCYVIFAWTWDLPVQSPSKRFFRWIAEPFAWIGLWHQWTMFAPHPIRSNDVLVAEVYEGQQKQFEWVADHSTEDSLRERFLQSRENKFFENLCNGRYEWMYTVLAEQIQQQAESCGSHPTHIVIRRLRSPITLDPVVGPVNVFDSVLYLHHAQPHIR